MTTVDTTPKRYPVLDRAATIDGSYVATWINAGRGVHVWRNVDLSSPHVGALTFTPGDREKPHWNCERVEGPIWDVDRFILFLRVGVASRLYGDSMSSYRAAVDALRRLEAEEPSPREAPIGTVWVAFSVELVTYQTEEKVKMQPHIGSAYDRPLATISGYQVIRWSAIDKRTP